METPHLSYNPVVPTLRPPLSRTAQVARVKAAMLRAVGNTLDRSGFTQVISQSLTTMAGACGDPGTLIPVDLGGKQAYLSQTAQLHLEPLMRELGRVYSISRSFRAERRIDSRHLAEFTLIEAEAEAVSLDELMRLMEQLVVEMLEQARTAGGMQFPPQGTAGHTPRAPFSRMTYDDAIITLQKAGHFIEWGEDLSNTHEIALTGLVGGPLFVTHYPVSLRFFTMKVCRHDPRVVECCDLLLPGVGEVMGASETEHDPALMESKLRASTTVRQLEDLGGTTDSYNWYIAMHRQASIQQSGFGMGFERMVRYACGLESVAEA